MSTPANMMQMPPGEDPLDYAKLMRQQQIAEMLTQSALTPATVQQPQGSNRGFYQASRVSPLSGLAKLAEAYMARKSMDSSNQGMAQMYARGLQAFQPGGGPPPAPTSAPQPQPGIGVPPTSGGFGGGAGANDAGQPGSTAAPPPSVNPLNPTALPVQPLMRLYMQDPAKYLDQIKGTPEWQTLLAAYGGNVTAAQAAFKAKMTKEGAISNRQGEENMIPDGQGGYRFIRTPNLSPNQDYTRDAGTGSIIETHLIPGAAEAARQQELAQTTGKNQGEVHEFHTPGGGTTYSFGLPSNLPGAPRNYFGPGAPLPGSPPSTAPGPGAAPPPRPPIPPAAGGGAPAPRPTVPPNAPGAPPSAPPGVTPGIWRNAPQRPNTGGLGEDPYLKGQVEGMVKKNDELTDKYGSEADLADQRIAFNNEALKVLSQANTGPMYDTVNTLKKRALELGVPAQWLPGGDVNSTDELKKFLLRNPLLSLKPTFGGRPAASEFQILANDASPSPQMMQGAIQRLVQLDNQAAGFSKQRATDYAYYHDHVSGNPQRFESWYANKVPFAQWLDQHPSGRSGEAHIETGKPGVPAAIANEGNVTYEKRGGQWFPKTSP